MNQDKNPLVSIIVITYNSAKFVLETLESAKAQTYQNIELIISDDCSSDNTIEICKEWLKENKDRFVNTELITVGKNTGIPANCNRGVKASKGEWIKLIAGDDLIDETLVSEYLKKISILGDNFILCSNYRIIDESSRKIGAVNLKKTKFFHQLKNSEEQFQMALRISGTIPPLTAFYSREMYDTVGGFDERFKLLEDYPFFLKLNQKGFYAILIEKELASYRKSSTSVTAAGENRIFHPIFLQTFRFQAMYCKNHVSSIEALGFIFNELIHRFFQQKNLNNKKFTKLYWILFRLNPYIVKRFFLGCSNRVYYQNLI
ncbi:glycosyltransferase [Cecembia lonarensis]|uniref:Glycosyltransferase 2-like domain-containing protein n=1 Tax=Cecembia lonarensis (strain CCUG 58316 / KCTC 22772 / LW9) TaxID=1225176 RepID=K1LFV1_CECL9|nr:glycosyltransferase [Cecembia lonarensis]EKB49153.1 hypothetical protein B879_02251 [Cecembia lonarensis LW9]